MAWGGTSISGCPIPPLPLTSPSEHPSSAPAINKEYINQNKQSTASQLSDTPTSLTLTLTLTSAISSHNRGGKARNSRTVITQVTS